MRRAQLSRNGKGPNVRYHSPVSDDKGVNAQGWTALVVDDDPVMCRLASAMLVRIGFSVRTAVEGAQALFDFSLTPCDLVLTDYEMPAINGYQLGRKIKSQRPGTRVVIMTGLCRTAVKGLMNDDGIDGWLFKPYGLEELKILLERLGLPG